MSTAPRGFICCYTACMKIPLLLGAVAILQLGDFATTLRALQRGGTELNPLGAFAVSHGLLAMLLVRAATMAAFFAIAFILRRDPRAQRWLLAILVISVVLLLAIDVSNLLII